jgi:hypothetical protein
MAKRFFFPLRDSIGVDLTINARVVSPGSFKALKNLYMPNPGRLEQRPGTLEFAQKVVVGERTSYTDNPDDFRPPQTIDKLAVENQTNAGDISTAHSRLEAAPMTVAAGATNRFTPVAAGTTIYDITF